MTALLLQLLPSGVAPGHRFCIFGSILRVSPVGQVVALAGENIEGLDCQTTDGAGVLIPSLAAVNGERPTPYIIYICPRFIGQMRIITPFDCFRLGVGGKGIKRLLRGAAVRFLPSIENSTVLLVAIIQCLHFDTIFLRFPKIFCIFEIKKMCRLNWASQCWC